MRYRPPVSELDILVLGPVPPPYGGVSVHVQRLVPLLERAGYRVGVLNHFGSTEMPFVLDSLRRNPIRYCRLPRRFPVRLVHYHHSRWSTLLGVAIGRKRGTRYVLTLHAADLQKQLNSRVPGVRRVTVWSLQRFDAFIVVNPAFATLLRAHVGDKQILAIPAYISADSEEFSYDAPLEAFLARGPTIVVTAYDVQLMADGRDLYGLDMAVTAFAAIAQERPTLQLAIFLARRAARRRAAAYLANLEASLRRSGLEERVRVAYGLPLVPVFRHDVIFVRPTRVEGDALSVREARATGVPVVASDIAARPDGVVVFPTDDVEALSDSIRRALDGPRTPPAAPAASEQFLEPLLGFFANQLATHDGFAR
jgi:glycosyltransferase involved in cell wall biosynthesis